MSTQHQANPKDSYLWPTLGFFVAATLTLIAFDSTSKILILVLAIAQLITQLYFFIHLGRGDGRRWNIAIGILGVVLLLAIGIGTVWVMNHLQANMMPKTGDLYINSIVSPANETRP